MTLTEKEKRNIRTFVCEQLGEEGDLSTLTLGILKKRYLAHRRCDSLTSDAKYFMKQVVTEELVKMQDSEGDEKELEKKSHPKKRKREKEHCDEGINGKKDEEESKAKKSRHHSSSSSESNDEEDDQTQSKENKEETIESCSEDEEQAVKKTQRKKNKLHSDSDASSDEDMNETGQKGSEGGESDSDDGKDIKKEKDDETGSSKESQGKKTPQSGDENESGSDGESKTSINANRIDLSDDGGKEERSLADKKKEDSDSDSSSLQSSEDEEENRRVDGNEEKKTNEEKSTKKSKKGNTKRQRDLEKSVSRLKHYISLCGVRLHYKKLLSNCHSTQSQITVLKKKLEELGVDGQPSIKKCKKVRKKREKAQELAELDTNNIIETKGRPTRRAATLKRHSPLPSAHVRALNSSSDSEQENKAQRGNRRAVNWANLKGIISDDADSN